MFSLKTIKIIDPFIHKKNPLKPLVFNFFKQYDYTFFLENIKFFTSC